MQIHFIPHQLSIMGYSHSIMAIRPRYKLMFIVSITIILIGIYLYGTSFIINPSEWFARLQDPDILDRFFISIGRFFTNLLSAIPIVLTVYAGLVTGWFLSRLIVSIVFAGYRKSKKKFYYVIKPINEPLPAGYGYKLPLSKIKQTFYLGIIFSALILAIFSNITLDFYGNIFRSSAIIFMLPFCFIDYSHFLIISDSKKEVIFTMKSFGRLFRAPNGMSKHYSTTFEPGTKGIQAKNVGLTTTVCPHCHSPLYGHSVVHCPNCSFNLLNIICPICREKFSIVDEKGYCPKCKIMYHLSHLTIFISVYKKCPNCHQSLTYEEVISYKNQLAEMSPAAHTKKGTG
jgi:hypothetical protein